MGTHIMRSQQIGVLAIPFKFATDASGDPTAATAAGNGYTVTQTDRGKYRLTLKDSFVNLDGAEVHTDSRLKPVVGAEDVDGSTPYVDIYVYDESAVIALGAVDADAADAIHAAVASSAAAGSFDTITQPDVPRTILCTFAASYDGGDITIVGTDQFGEPLTEVVAAGDGTAVSTDAAFATITSIEKAAVGATANTVTIGTSDEVGALCDVVAGKLMVQDDTAGGGGTVTGTFDATNDTVTLATDVPDGTTNYFIVGEHRTLKNVVSGNVYGVIYVNTTGARSKP